MKRRSTLGNGPKRAATIPAAPWTDLERHAAEAAQDRAVADAQRLLPGVVPGADFAAAEWPIGALTRVDVGDRQLSFAAPAPAGRRARRTEPLPSAIADLIKAFCLDSDASIDYLTFVAVSLCEFAAFFLRSDRARRWQDVSGDDLRRYEVALERELGPAQDEKYSLATRYHRATIACQFVEWLTAIGVAAPSGYVLWTPHPGWEATATIEGRRAAEGAKKATDVLVAALADIFYALINGARQARGESDVVLLCICVLHWLCGLRLGETLSLPADLERWQRVRPVGGRQAVPTGPLLTVAPDAAHPSDGTDAAPQTPDGSGEERSEDNEFRYGLLFYPEKARAKKAQIKWVSPTVAPEVRACVARIRAFGEAARARARELEASPHGVALPAPYDHPDAFVPRAALAALVGVGPAALYLKPWSTLQKVYVPKPKGQRGGNATQVGVRAGDLAMLLQGMRREREVARRFPTGKPLLRSECLTTMFLHAWDTGRVGANVQLVRELPASVILRFLGASSNRVHKVTVFDRYGDDDAVRAYRTGSHAFRHWLNDEAFKGKLSIADLTRYFERKDPRQTRAYIHSADDEPSPPLDLAQVGAFIREGIRTRRFIGPLVTAFFRLDEQAGRELLEAHVQIGHWTGTNLCVRRIERPACDRHLTCFVGPCPQYVGTKGDPGEIESITDLISKHERLLHQAESAAAAGHPGGAGYAAHNKLVLAGLRQALAMHHDPDVPEGAEVQVFHGAPDPVDRA